MGSLKQAIHTIPIIDHHAHNLLLAANIQNRNRLSIFTEANGSALEDSTSSLAFQRGVRQLSCVLGCENTWDAVEQAILAKHRGSSDEWAKECFSGIETLLIDDGLDPSDVHPYSWHDRLVRSKCRRIVRIERIAERHIQTGIRNRLSLDERYMTDIAKHFESDIEAAITDPQVAGFKSVICYRTGLRITPYREPDAGELGSISGDSDSQKAFRLEHESLNPFFVHLTARVLQRLKCKKPFQFHTGLGDNDINLYLSNPAHLQPFIETYPEVNIVLLHASYPFTKEAGYLATVFKNVYMDIGEVFPFLRSVSSQFGYKKIGDRFYFPSSKPCP